MRGSWAFHRERSQGYRHSIVTPPPFVVQGHVLLVAASTHAQLGDAVHAAGSVSHVALKFEPASGNGTPPPLSRQYCAPTSHVAVPQANVAEPVSVEDASASVPPSPSESPAVPIVVPPHAPARSVSSGAKPAR